MSRVSDYRFSDRIILECECGERMYLLGTEEDWRSRRPIFRCECGQNLTLDDRADGDVLATSHAV